MSFIDVVRERRGNREWHDVLVHPGRLAWEYGLERFMFCQQGSDPDRAGDASRFGKTYFSIPCGITLRRKPAS